MKKGVWLAVGALLAGAAMASTTRYALELKGGSRVLALDKPVRRGRVVLFHRYPDGVFVSLGASEVDRIVETEEAPKPEKPEKLAPGQTVVIGTDLEGPGYLAPPVPAVPAPAQPFPGYGYGYEGWYWGGGGAVLPPRPPGPVPPSRIGPNGFPILAPPGSPGSTPPPIGSNGFPILAPQAPAPSPRQR